MSASTAAVPLPDRARAVLTYWFGKNYIDELPDAWAPPEFEKKWFQGGPEVDKEVVEQFSADIEAVGAGLYDPWIEHPLSAMAGIILMDQFTRNAFRGTAKMYSLDTKARTWALHMWDTGRAWSLPVGMWMFVGLPLEHAEDLALQQRCVDLNEEFMRRWAEAHPGEEEVMKKLKYITQYAIAHRDVVEKWGRFPHRNVLLGRPSTPEEEAGMAAGQIPKF